MLRILLAAVLAISMGGPLRAQDAEIQGVIQSQIDAFLKDDFAAAFTFASPTIKGMFGTPDNFGAMVRQGYPMVWRPAEVEFREREQRDGRTYQRVLLRDAGGNLFAAEYEMIETGDGWQINGVQVLKLPAVGA